VGRERKKGGCQVGPQACGSWVNGDADGVCRSGPLTRKWNLKFG
jgi:hypothetical protein